MRVSARLVKRVALLRKLSTGAFGHHVVRSGKEGKGNPRGVFDDGLRVEFVRTNVFSGLETPVGWEVVSYSVFVAAEER
jgi:hypothetical protein